jgi:hypothetical protein
MFLLATIGSAALYLLFVWLVSAAAAAWLADRKGYTERVGLMFGLILSAVGFLIVLLLPARPGSVWKVEGRLPNPGARRPLGVPALGPAAASDTSDALGPALSEAPPTPGPRSDPPPADQALGPPADPAGDDEPQAG